MYCVSWDFASAIQIPTSEMKEGRVMGGTYNLQTRNVVPISQNTARILAGWSLRPCRENIPADGSLHRLPGLIADLARTGRVRGHC